MAASMGLLRRLIRKQRHIANTLSNLCGNASDNRLIDNARLTYCKIQEFKSFHTSAGPLRHGEHEMRDPKSEDEVVNITYIDKNGERLAIRGKIGDNLMYLAHRYNIELEGACEASLACSTCHVYVHQDYLDKLEEPLEDEEDMLDMAAALKQNSRLGCQIVLSKDLEGLEVKLPPMTRNFYVDGHVPQPH